MTAVVCLTESSSARATGTGAGWRNPEHAAAAGLPISLTNCSFQQSAQPAIQAAVRMAERLHCPSGIFTLLQVGEKKSMPGFMASMM